MTQKRERAETSKAQCDFAAKKLEDNLVAASKKSCVCSWSVRQNTKKSDLVKDQRKG